MKMDKKQTRKRVWIFLLACLPVSNVLWYIGYSRNARDAEDALAQSIVILTSFLPALVTLVMSKLTKEGWDSLKILPHIRKAWKVYIFAVVCCWIMVYIGDPLMLLLFRGEVIYSLTLGGIGQILGMTALGVAASIEMLGEELGWLGYLFPKLEKLHGTNAAIVLLALARTVWHLGILAFFPHPVIGTCDLFLSNLLSQSLLVYVVKKSDSLFPAAVIHAMTNVLPVFLVYSDAFYQEHILAMNGVGLVPALLVGGFCYWRMKREKMIYAKVPAL